jgi:ribosomal protein S14
MHCRNIAINVVAPPPKLAKAARKRHGVPLVRFRTINIEPMRQVLRTEGRSHETGIKRALHICRGHFRTYSEEKPLFGRVSGTFFIPAHARGSASEGVVVPQYAVDVPDTR